MLTRIILAFSAMTSFAAIELNLLANGDFEAGSWSQAVWDGQGKAAISTDQFHGGAKSPERFRRELRLISHAGARDIMIYLYSTLRHKPELREAIRQELAD